MAIPNFQRATISDVAQLAGVSIATVSRVLNKSAPVNDTTVAKVRRAIETLGFQPHAAARTLAGGKTATLGLLVPILSNPFFSSLIQGIELAARTHGYHLLIYSTNLDLPQQSRHARPLDEHNTDGLLVFTDNLDETEIAQLYQQRFPLVLLMRSAPQGLPLATVTIDNGVGTRTALQHLIRTCRRQRIGFLRGPAGNEDSLERELMYRQVLTEEHIEIDPHLITQGDFSESVSYQAVKRWLAQGVRFDALFPGDDLAALGAIAALREANLSVPEDVSVIGFDDMALALHVQPPLTTVHVPIEEVGKAGVDLLVQQIQTGVVASVRLPTRLIVRQSCGGAQDGYPE